MKLFISYSRDDQSFVYELARRLNDEAQHDVWIDKRLTGAALWWDTILNHIELCECFVYIMTPRSVSSIFCTAELNYALQLQKPVLPLMLKSVEMPAALRRIQYIDVSQKPLIEILLSSVQALHNVEIESLKSGHVWKMPSPPPQRPDIPEPLPGVHEHLYEVFAEAEAAYAEDQVDLAQDLYQRVMRNDPNNLGKVAQERIQQLQQRRSMIRAYDAITGMLTDQRLTEAARSLWLNYVQEFGGNYDPAELATRFGHPARAIPTTSDATPQTGAQLPSLTLPELSNVTDVKVSIVAPVTASTKQPSNIRSVSLEGMVLIPASTFVFGDGQRISLAAYYIDIYPVTNQDYLRFVMETRSPLPERWKAGQMPFPIEKAHHPVTGISAEEAELYSAWLGKRLPNIQEWEKAGRGTQGWLYPWGNQFDPLRCNSAASKHKGTTPVNQFPQGFSYFGVADMAGNVWEWTASSTESKAIGKSAPRVIKGGAYNVQPSGLRCDNSSVFTANQRRIDIGFRCAYSAES